MSMIEVSPGIRFREIMRRTGLGNGVLSHHLYTMEKVGMIQVLRWPRQTSYAATDISYPLLKVASILQRSTQRCILLALAAKDGRRLSELAKECDRSPSTVSSHITKLAEKGLVKTRGLGAAKRYRINCRGEVDILVRTYGSDAFGKSAPGPEGTSDSP